MITVNTIFKNNNNFCKIKLNKKDNTYAYGLNVNVFKSKINFRVKEMLYFYDNTLNSIVNIPNELGGDYGVYMYYDISVMMPIYFGIYNKKNQNNRPVNIIGHNEVYYNYNSNLKNLAILKLCDNCNKQTAEEIETYLINLHDYTLNKKASTKRILKYNISKHFCKLIE